MRRTTHLPLITALMAGLTLAGCDGEQPDRPAADDAAAPAQTPQGAQDAAATDAEAAAPADAAGAMAEADPGLLSTTSPLSVQMTVDNLAAAVKERGFTVISRIDHSAGAARVDMDLRPTQLLIFGNPAGGTPLMQAAPTLALDLPLKVAVYEGEDGTTHLVYNDPAVMLTRHGLAADHPAVAKMTGLLESVTAAAGEPTPDDSGDAK